MRIFLQKASGCPLSLAVLRLLTTLWLLGQVLLAQSDTVLTLAHAYTAMGERQGSPTGLGDGQGGLWIAYTGTRGPLSQPAIILQHLDDRGQPLLPADGWQLCPTQFAQTTPRLLPDGKGGIFVLWEEQREFLRGIYGLRLSAQAEPLWSPHGEYLAPAAEQNTRYAAIGDGQEGLYLCWEDLRGAERLRRVYVQHIGTFGLPLWVFEGMEVCLQPSLQQRPQLDRTPTGGLLVLWEDYRSGQGWDLFAQKFTPDGEPEWSRLGVPVPPPLPGTSLQHPVLQSDGFGGLLCAYEVVGTGTQGKDLYMSRISRNGQGVYHAPVCRAPGNQLKPRMVPKGADILVYWEDHRGKDADLYVQRLEIQEGVPWWSENGVLACLSGAEQTAPQSGDPSLHGDQVLLWQDNRGGTHSLYAQKIGADGIAIWAFEGVELVGGTWAKHDARLVADEKGGAWVLWMDERNPLNHRIYYTHIDVMGQPSAATALGLEWEQAEAAIQYPAIVAGTAQDLYVVWEDFRNGARNSDLYGLRLDHNGHTQWTANGYPIACGPSYQSLPMLLPLPAGLHLAWLDHRNGPSDDLYYQQLQYNAQLRLPLGGAPLCTAFRSQNDLSQAIGNDQKWWAAWTDSRDFIEKGFKVYVDKTDLTTGRRLQSDGLPVADGTTYQTGPALALDAEGYAYLAWMDEQEGHYNIRMQLYNTTGLPLWGPQGRALSPSAAHQRYPQILCPQGGGALAVWADDRVSQQFTKIILQKILPDGTKPLGETGTTVCPRYGRQTHPALVDAGKGQYVIAWLDQRSESTTGHQLIAQLIDASGMLQWAEEGVPIGEFLHENYPYSIAISPKGYALYTWQCRVTDEGNEQVYYVLQSLATGHVLKRGRAETTDAHQLQPVVAATADSFAIVWVEKEAEAGAHRLKMRLVHLP